MLYRHTALVTCLMILLMTPLNVSANPQSCATLSDDAARLYCFDSIFTPSPGSNESGETVAVLSSDTLSGLPPLESRKVQEIVNTREDFAITPHKPNYILPLSYNGSSNYDAYGPFGNSFSDTEIKMQLSLKTRIIPNLWGDSSLWVAYTQQSYWQLYADPDASAPFRETNHQPEVFWEVPVDFNILGWDARLAKLAFNHQSNGRTEPLSRSWNRITGELIMEKGGFVASAKTWYRITEDVENDNNPNIEDFMGRLQLGLAYKLRDNVFSVGIKNNLSSENRSGLELNWTFPLVQKLRGFVQVYSGYGENLIDMENYNNRIGIGIALTDWL